MTTATKSRYVSAITITTTSTGKTRTTINVEQMVKNVKEGGLDGAIKAIEQAEMLLIKAAKATAGTYWDLGEVFQKEDYGKLRKGHKKLFWANLGDAYETDSPNRRRCERAIRIRNQNDKREDVLDRTVNQAMLYGSRVKMNVASVKDLNVQVRDAAIEIREDRETREKAIPRVAADPIVKAVGTLINSDLYCDTKLGTKAEQLAAGKVIKTVNNKLKKLKGMSGLSSNLRPIVIMQLVVQHLAELYPNELLLGNYWDQTEEEFMEFVGEGCDPADERLLRMERAVNEMFAAQEDDAA